MELKRLGITQAAADARYLKLDTSNDPITGALTTSNGSPLANAAASGVLTLGGTGGTNNENITFDFETTNTFVSLGSSAGTNNFIFDNFHIKIIDDFSLGFGDRGSFDAGIIWETTGNLEKKNP